MHTWAMHGLFRGNVAAQGRAATQGEEEIRALRNAW